MTSSELTQRRPSTMPLEVPRKVEPHQHRGNFARIRTFGCTDLEHVTHLFDDVPLDGYVSEGFRRKSISRVRIADRGVVVGEHGPLFQSRKYNPTHGDVVRHYAAIAPDLLQELEGIIRMFWACARLPVDDEILVQAQRITATAGKAGDTGHPAIEGFHQDNVDLVGIFVVGRTNISGGMTVLSETPGLDGAVFAGQLDPGDLIVFDDRRLWHYTTPVRRVDAGSPACRDVVLLATPSSRIEQWTDA